VSDLRSIARALGGHVSAGQVLAPGPGHSPRDRSMSVKPTADGDFLVYSFAAADPIVCKDYVRQRLGMSQWHPGKGNGHAKVGKAKGSQRPEPKGAARSTVEAVMYELREYGLAAFDAPNCRERLADLSAPQVDEAIERLAALQPRYPKIADDLILVLAELKS